ncbi:MAG: ferritin family protein [Syntrophomonas sp.]|nr:ferritin family protein [Syntrophomonas sp.]
MDKKDFENIMDMAIAAEIEAYEFYRDVAAKISDAGMKKLFQEFADEEQGHKKALENIKAKEIQNFSFTSGPNYKISEMVELPKLSIDMKPADAIALAMKKEEESMNTYSYLASVTDDPDKKNLFAGLAKMEEGHKVRMEGLYTDTAYPEVW